MDSVEVVERLRTVPGTGRGVHRPSPAHRAHPLDEVVVLKMTGDEGGNDDDQGQECQGQRY